VYELATSARDQCVVVGKVVGSDHLPIGVLACMQAGEQFVKASRHHDERRKVFHASLCLQLTSVRTHSDDCALWLCVEW
jgi:hypothetical protein